MNWLGLAWEFREIHLESGRVAYSFFKAEQLMPISAAKSPFERLRERVVGAEGASNTVH